MRTSYLDLYAEVMDVLRPKLTDSHPLMERLRRGQVTPMQVGEVLAEILFISMVDEGVAVEQPLLSTGIK